MTKRVRHGGLLLATVLTFGCAGVAPQTSSPPQPSLGPAHEAVLPPEPHDSVDQLYVNMVTIARAAEKYYAKHDEMPNVIWALESDELLKTIPLMAKEHGGGDYSVRKGYDNMDGKGAWDDAVYSGENVPGDLCREFNRRYAGAPLNEGIIHDYEAAGNNYPGEVYGRNMRVFAIKWKSTYDVCEIDWVIRYND